MIVNRISLILCCFQNIWNYELFLTAKRVYETNMLVLNEVSGVITCSNDTDGSGCYYSMLNCIENKY